jgi:hypothetical protein
MSDSDESQESPYEPEPGLSFLDMRGGMKRSEETGRWAPTPGGEHTVQAVFGSSAKPGTWIVRVTGGALFMIKRLPSGSWVEV